MSNNTPENYEDFFLQKFVTLFKKFINTTLDRVTDKGIIDNLTKINNSFDKLNYSKIMLKISSSEILQQSLLTFSNNNFEDKALLVILKKTDKKIWTLIPSINIDKIFINLLLEYRKSCYDLIYSIFICCRSYQNIKTTSESVFNPYMTSDGVNNNYCLNNVVENYKVETPDSYEFMIETLTKQLLNDGTDKDLDNQIKNMKDEDINNATMNINKLLIDEANGGNKSALIISTMLEKLKNEIVDLKNTPDANDGGQGLKKIFGIAQKITGEMQTNLSGQKINPLELWDTTANLANQTINTPSLNLISGLIRSQIENNMNGKTNNEELKGELLNAMQNLNISK
jgi:hypothetical protein